MTSSFNIALHKLVFVAGIPKNASFHSSVHKYRWDSVDFVFCSHIDANEQFYRFPTTIIEVLGNRIFPVEAFRSSLEAVAGHLRGTSREISGLLEGAFAPNKYVMMCSLKFTEKLIDRVKGIQTLII